MDFIAEMVLGFADTELSVRIDSEKIKDFRILRYRDDYRIFVNNPPGWRTYPQVSCRSHE